MNYATGYAFNVYEMLYEFNCKKLKLTTKGCKELISTPDRKYMVSKVFVQSVKLILEDIIYNNATFRLPTATECYFYLKPFRNEQFVKFRRMGRWREVDFIETNYTGYQLTFKYKSGKLMLEKPIYLCPKYRDAIVEHINNGQMYHDGNVKTLKDYLPTMHEKFPELVPSDIDYMLKQAWKNIPKFTFRRADILVSYSKENLWMLIGYLRRNPVAHLEYYTRKYALKCRTFYILRRTKWDGYYYFGVTQKELEEFKSTLGKRGIRKNKIYTFKSKVLYRVFEEANYRGRNYFAILRITPPTYLGYSYYKSELKCKTPEIVLERPPLKFKDILVANNK